jgi:glycosyltransferase involved in cell wall biosynthesis
MTIGIDIRPLQMHHRYRGIGMHMIHLLEELPGRLMRNEKLLFYCYEGLDVPPEISKLPKSVRYELVYIPQTFASNRRIPFFIKESMQNFRRVTRPLNSELVNKSDVYVMFDFMHGLPLVKDTKIVTVAYDLIPFIFPNEYFPNFFIALRRHGFNEAVRDSIVKRLYKWAAVQTVDRSTYLLSISNSTRDQFEHVIPGSAKKIHTVYLGRPETVDTKNVKPPTILAEKKRPYILYVGGGDPRRKIEDLVLAFDNIKADHPDLLLVLAGKDFTSLETIPTKKIAQAIRTSKFRNDILLLGFVSDEERTLLYKKALCFVYPTLSEGFGLPILEAMQEECPVITYDYKYSSIAEVAGEAALVLNAQHGSQGIYDSLQKIIESKQLAETLKQKGLSNIKRFSWDKNAEETLRFIRKSLTL